LLIVKQLECVRGERRLFRGLGLVLGPGESLQVEGPNGSGKTSLLRICAGLLTPAGGAVLWRAQSIRELAEDYRGEMLYLGHANAIKEELTGFENLDCALQLAGEPAGAQNIREALAEFGLRGREQLPVRYLSQGQKRRVTLARLRITQRPLWILDEPFTALDTGAVQLLADTLARHQNAGGMVLFTTHQEVNLPGAPVRKLRLDS
jgi:heme exporter protein A